MKRYMWPSAASELAPSKSADTPRRRHRRLSDREEAIRAAIESMPNEFAVEQLIPAIVEQHRPLNKSQRDELRRTLNNRQEELGVTLEGHTVRKRPPATPEPEGE